MIDYRTTAMALLLPMALLFACSKKDNDQPQGLPPAAEWKTPDPAAAAGAPANPHAGGLPGTGVPPANPHAGGLPGAADAPGANPHEGVPGAPGMPGANPHAGVPGAPGGPAAGGVDVGSLGLEPPDPGRSIDPDKYLKGSIKPTEQTTPGIPKGAVIFLSVKRADPKTGAAMGGPLAVKRLRLSTWPVWFNLTEEDAMTMGTTLSGDVVITAWADQDQDAMSKSPGDVLGTVRATVPAKDLTLTLDTVLK